MDETVQRLVKCFSAVFPWMTADEILRATPENTVRWDSLARVNLYAAVQEELGIELPPDTLETFDSFDRVLACVRDAQDSEE